MGFTPGGGPRAKPKTKTAPTSGSFTLGGGPLAGRKPSGKKSDGGGSFLGRLGSNLRDVALHAPGGLKLAGEAAGKDLLDTITFKQSHGKSRLLDEVLIPSAKQTVEDLKHPLRNPGYTALDLLGLASGGAGAATRAVAAGKAVGETGLLSAGARALARAPKPGQRTVKVGELEVRGHYSRAPLARGVQKTVDKGLQKAAGKSVRAENLLHRRAAKWQQRAERVADAKARSTGTRLQALGAKLKPEELRALRLVAEEVPVGRRLGAQEMRAARASGKEAARHQERIDLTRKALEFLDEGPDRKPVFKPEAGKLRNVYRLLEQASAERGGILKQLDLLDEAAQQQAKTNAARVAAGARMETQKEATAARGVRPKRARVEQIREYPARSKTVARPRSLEEAQARLAEIDRRYSDLVEKVAPAFEPPNPRAEQALRNVETGKARRQRAGVDRRGKTSSRSGGSFARIRSTVKEETRKLAERKIDELIRRNPKHPVARRVSALLDEARQLRQAIEQATQPAFMREAAAAAPDFGSVTETIPGKPRRVHLREQAASKGVKAKPRLVGAEDIAVSPEAPFIGNPVERGRITGKPKVSSTSTFGHTPKPTSLKRATGAAVEHALERNDVTNIVAERHREAARLGSIHRRSQQLAKAGEHAPRRKDDVFVWTDRTVSQERIPTEVRRFLDNPDGLAALPEHEQASVIQQLKDGMFTRGDWRNPDMVAEFERLAADGKGVFVPRRLMGDLTKSDYQVSGIPGMRFVDAVNNAQKAGLIYLKLNYPVIQTVSNAGMSLIQQGFAYPVNLTRAVKLDKKIGVDGAAVVDDIMGQGAVLQAAFEGQGAVSRATQLLAHVMTSKVDTPARRAAFLHEAAKAGYGTPEKLRQLLENDQLAGDLAEVAQRAKEAIVDYGELSPFERQVVRRLVFVFPWQKGATKYAGHFLRDHPVQAAALGMLAEQGKQQSESAFGEVPSYLRGLIPVDGKAVNPAGVNFFQTPAQIGEAITGLATGNPAAPTGADFLSPFPGLAVSLATGRDNLGFPLKGALPQRLRALTVEQTPIAAAARAAVAGREGAAPNIARALIGSRSSSRTFPNPADAYWRFLLGGLYPREYNRGALNQNAARERSPR